MATDNVGGMTDAPIDRWEWCGLMDAYINVPDGDYVRHADYIAERDALRQWRVDMCERLGFDCAAGAQWTTEDIASELRRDELKLIADRDRLAARCTSLEETNEGLERDAARYRWLRDPESKPALVLDKVTGYVPWHEGTDTGGYSTYEYRCGDELDAAIDAALSPPASDAADSGRVCKCNLRTKLVGDGCHICNPEYAAQFDDDGSEPLAAGVAG